LISFRVRSFAPTDAYNLGKPFQTRLMWLDPNGDSRSKLLGDESKQKFRVLL